MFGSPAARRLPTACLCIVYALLAHPPAEAGEPALPIRKAQALLYLTRRPTPGEMAARDTRARYEPPVGCYLGAFIDFDPALKRPYRDINQTDHQDPTAFEASVGKLHASYFFYLGYGKPAPLDWIRSLASRNKFVHVALEPNDGLARVRDDAYLRKLADDFRRSGAKIFLRFASEMNGDWTNYHKNPREYRKKFRLVYSVMHRRAPNVALVWCPYTMPNWNIPDYYPGDDATDWVGVNLYSVTFHNNDRRCPCEYEHTADMLTPVYNLYSRRKPIMICEYAATHYASCEKRPRQDFALRKILTLYTALPRLFPRVKCINYFDGNAIHFAGDHAYNDYSVTDDAIVNGIYRNAVSPDYYLPTILPDSRPNPWHMPPMIPMPLRAGELLRGKVVLSCWARTPSDLLSVRYRLDGRIIYKANRPDRWQHVWDAGSVPPGRHVLTLEAVRRNGSVAASQKVSVRTARD